MDKTHTDVLKITMNVTLTTIWSRKCSIHVNSGFVALKAYHVEHYLLSGHENVNACEQ